MQLQQSLQPVVLEDDQLDVRLRGYTRSSADLHAVMQVLLDRLAAQELVLLQRPVISGHYTGSPFVNMLAGPLDGSLRALFKQVLHVGELVQHALSEESEAGQLAELDTAVQAVEDAR